MEIFVTYRNLLMKDEEKLVAGVCQSTSYVDTDEEEKYLNFCERIANLSTGVSGPTAFGKEVRFCDFQLWIGDISYGFPKPIDCATPKAVKKHIEYCMDMHEAFYVE
jgi:hypothetical protein